MCLSVEERALLIDSPPVELVWSLLVAAQDPQKLSIDAAVAGAKSHGREGGLKRGGLRGSVADAVRRDTGALNIIETSSILPMALY